MRLKLSLLKSRSITIIFIIYEETGMPKPTIIEVIKSVLSAAVGVQSNKNRLKDFEQGSLAVYIVAGLIFTALFVIGLVFLVSKVIGA